MTEYITSMDRADMKQEAINRMKLLDIRPSTIKAYDCLGFVFTCEPPFGGLCLTYETETEEVEKWEQEHNCLVFLIIRSYTSIGLMDSYLYVSSNKEEWDQDRALLKQGEAIAYVVNRDDPWCSEFSKIAFKHSIGDGLIRTV